MGILDRPAGKIEEDRNTRSAEPLFLAPQPQNDAEYLFDNAEGSGRGYVELTYREFQKPLLFTELGKDRTKPNYLNVVDGQLNRSIAYGAQHPEQLKGICNFQFDDKVWMCPTGDPPRGHCPTEGLFGVFSHTNDVLFTVNYVPADFTHFDNGPCDHEQLKPDRLTQIRSTRRSWGSTPRAKRPCCCGKI